MTYSLDIETFISEVQKHPVIWDPSSDGYRYRHNKLEALAQVARVFIPDFDEMTEIEKDEVYKKMFAKWRNIRDSYCRHVQKKYGKKGYMYAKHLSFLDKNYENRNYDKNKSTIYLMAKHGNTGSDGDGNMATANQDDSDSDDEKKVQKLKKIGFVKSGTKDRQYLEVSDGWQGEDMEASTSEKQDQSAEPIAEPNIEYVDAHNMLPDATSSSSVDEDRSFFESLLPAVKDFDIDTKLEFRYGVLKLLKSLRSNHRKRIKRDPVDAGDDDEEDF